MNQTNTSRNNLIDETLNNKLQFSQDLSITEKYKNGQKEQDAYNGVFYRRYLFQSDLDDQDFKTKNLQIESPVFCSFLDTNSKKESKKSFNNKSVKQQNNQKIQLNQESQNNLQKQEELMSSSLCKSDTQLNLQLSQKQKKSQNSQKQSNNTVSSQNQIQQKSNSFKLKQQKQKKQNQYQSQNSSEKKDTNNQVKIEIKEVPKQDANNKACVNFSTSSKNLNQINLRDSISIDNQKIQFQEGTNNLSPNKRLTFKNPQSRFMDNINQKINLNNNNGNDEFFNQQKISKLLVLHKFKIAILSKQFVKFLKQLIRPSYLTKKQLNFINDLSDIRNSKSQEEKLFKKNSIFQRLKVIYNSLGTVHPQAKYEKVFLLLVLFFLIVEFFYIPYIICFHINDDIFSSELHQWVFFYAPLILFIFDTLHNFNRCFYSQGILVQDRVKIAKFNFKSIFWYNIIGILNLILVYNDFHYLDFLLIFRFKQITIKIQRLDQVFGIKYKYNIQYELTNLIIFILALTHIFGCLFYYIGDINLKDNKKNWISDSNLENSSSLDMYINSVYFIFVSMITVGYGDISPISISEKVYVIFMTIFSTAIFGYSINKVSDIFRQVSDKKKEFEKAKYSVQRYLSDRIENKELIYKILQNLEQIYQKQYDKNEEGARLVKEKIEQNLNSEFRKQFFGKIIENYKPFNMNFSQKTLEQIIQNMEEQFVPKKSIIFQKDEVCQNIFMLVKGKIQIFQQDANTKKINTLGQITEGKFFGVNNFLGHSIYEYSTMSLSDCHLIYISKENFKNIVQTNVRDYEILCKLHDDIVLNQNLLFQGIKCAACYTENHNIQFCPFLHLRVNKQILISKHNYSQKQIRNYNFIRNQKNKGNFNCLSQRYQCEQYLKSIRIDLICLYYQYQIQDEEKNEYIKYYSNIKRFLQDMPQIKGNQLKSTFQEDQQNKQYNSDNSDQDQQLINYENQFSQNSSFQTTSSDGTSISSFQQIKLEAKQSLIKSEKNQNIDELEDQYSHFTSIQQYHSNYLQRNHSQQQSWQGDQNEGNFNNKINNNHKKDSTINQQLQQQQQLQQGSWINNQENFKSEQLIKKFQKQNTFGQLINQNNNFSKNQLKDNITDNQDEIIQETSIDYFPQIGNQQSSHKITYNQQNSNFTEANNTKSKSNCDKNSNQIIYGQQISPLYPKTKKQNKEIDQHQNQKQNRQFLNFIAYQQNKAQQKYQDQVNKKLPENKFPSSRNFMNHNSFQFTPISTDRLNLMNISKNIQLQKKQIKSKLSNQGEINQEDLQKIKKLEQCEDEVDALLKVESIQMNDLQNGSSLINNPNNYNRFQKNSIKNQNHINWDSNVNNMPNNHNTNSTINNNIYNNNNNISYNNNNINNNAMNMSKQILMPIKRQLSINYGLQQNDISNQVQGNQLSYLNICNQDSNSILQDQQLPNNNQSNLNQKIEKLMIQLMNITNESKQNLQQDNPLIKQNSLQEENPLYDDSFDNIKEFEYYFPHNNFKEFGYNDLASFKSTNTKDASYCK